MSSILNIYNQQYNLGKLKKFDPIIERLRCEEADEHTLLFDDEINPPYDSPIFACKFAVKQNHDHYLALANEDGKLAIVNVSKAGERVGVWAHNNAIFDIAWPCDRMKVTTASGDHTVKLFDITDSGLREERIFYGHYRSVKTVSFRKEDPYTFASGGRDGDIIIWDTRMQERSFNISKPDCFISNAHAVAVPLTRSLKKIFNRTLPPAGVKSVTSIVFRDDNSLISCAAGDGLLKMWDLRKSYHIYRQKPAPRYVIRYPGEKAKNGFSNLVIDNECTKLYVNCLDNTIYCYNALTFNSVPIMEYKGHQNNTFYVKSALSPDGNYLISGSSDECAYIWKTNSSLPYVRLTGHNAEVTCVAWRMNQIPTIVTCSDDTKHKVWRVGTEKLPDHWQILGRGQAEVVNSKCSLLKSKPKLKRLISEVTASPHTYKKFIGQCNVCFKAVGGRASCENCNLIKSNSDVACSADTQSFFECHPRTLFGHLQQNIDNKKCISDNDAKSLYKSYSTEDVLNSPKSTHCSQFIDETLESPTVNLPNFIVDGVAPHVNHSPLKKKDVDWLTKMRVDTSFKKELFEKYNDSSPSKSLKAELSPRSGTNRKRSATTSAQSSLLKFFKVTNNKCDHLACCSKSHSCRQAPSPHSASQK